MTALIVVETGELVVEMTEEEASSITTRISVKLDAIADNYESVMPLIREAITRQAHSALGYASPGAYVADRFGSALSRLGTDLRRHVVHELSAAGLSTRAIAPVFDVSQKTIVKDRQVIPEVSPADGSTPEYVALEKSRASDPGDVSAGQEAATAIVDRQAGDVVENDPWGSSIDIEVEASASDYVTPQPAEPKPITGMDGKKYSNPPRNPKPDRRPDLTKSARSLSVDLYRMTNRIQKLGQDDRLGRNAEQVAALLRNHLSDAVEVCQDLLDRLPTPSEVTP